jgi:TatA/E family protein of Tat protein translocase
MATLPLAALDNPVDLALLLLVAFLLFGKQLPEVARNLGKGIRDLKASAKFDELSDALNSVNEVRSVVTPSNLVRAAVPGVAEFHDAVGAATDLVNPFAPAESTAGDAVDAPAADPAQAPSPAPPAEISE